MLRIIQKWLDEGGHYWKGIVIYGSTTGVDAKLLAEFQRGRSPEKERLLKELLTEAYKKLKGEDLMDFAGPAAAPETVSGSIDLYTVCKKEADTAYKELMNTRAVLFSLVNKPSPNSQDSDQRRTLALQVVSGFKRVSELYDKADHVLKHRSLPEVKQKADTEIPDFMVYCTLDNLRKNVNKLKKRTATPERIQLIAEQSLKIQELEARWHSLKQTLA